MRTVKNLSWFLLLSFAIFFLLFFPLPFPSPFFLYCMDTGHPSMHGSTQMNNTGENLPTRKYSIWGDGEWIKIKQCREISCHLLQKLRWWIQINSLTCVNISVSINWTLPFPGSINRSEEKVINGMKSSSPPLFNWPNLLWLGMLKIRAMQWRL